MKLNLPNRATPVAKTSLQEKTSGHKFSLPTKSKPAETISEKAAPKQGATGLNLSKPTSANASKGSTDSSIQQNQTKSNAIPEISEEKFNLIADVDPTFSTEAAIKFRDMLVMLEENIDNEGELQNVLKGTLTHLQENPEVDAILTPEDRATFVRAARKSYGITLVAKTTRKAKVTKSAAKVDELMDELCDLEFSI